MTAFAGAAFAVLVPGPAALAQQTPGAAPTTQAYPAAIEVGQIAPDFSIRVADSAGIRAEPVNLRDFRGSVVVLAFYPLDKSSGCTFQLTKFRDEYDKLFGDETVVLPISVDSLATHASWAAEMKFPFALGSDTDLSVARQYGSHTEGRKTSGRTVFVIGKDGKILWSNLRFPALNETAYSEMAAEVAKAR
ncbi:MAG: peroxiredoxin [Gemmatimonadaceae bacterium]